MADATKRTDLHSVPAGPGAEPVVAIERRHRSSPEEHAETGEALRSRVLLDRHQQRLVTYADACGRVLARAHAKASDVSVIAGYPGAGERFGEAMTRFGLAYADQAERDHAELESAVRKGRIVAYHEG